MDFRIQGSSGCASSHQHVAVRHALEPRLVPAVPPQKKLAVLNARNLHLQSVSRPFKLNEPSKETDRTIIFACRVFVCSQYAANALQPLVAVLCCLRKRRDSINLSCGQRFLNIFESVGRRQTLSWECVLWSCCVWSRSLTFGLSERTSICCSQELVDKMT